MKLKELIEKVREDTLTKEQVEGYYDQLTFLYYDMQTRMAECEKAEALYIVSNKTDKEVSDIAIKRNWNVTEQGLEMILLKRNLKAVEKVLSGLKTRIYRLL